MSRSILLLVCLVAFACIVQAEFPTGPCADNCKANWISCAKKGCTDNDCVARQKETCKPSVVACLKACPASGAAPAAPGTPPGTPQAPIIKTGNMCGVGQAVSTLTNPSSCIPCKANTFKDTVGNTYCKPCGPGQFNNAIGASSCSSCSAGQMLKNPDSDNNYGNNDSSKSGLKCVPCAAGTWSDKPDWRCNACNSGNYCPSSGQTKPTPCPLAYATKGDDREYSKCEKCEAGGFGGKIGTLKMQYTLPSKETIWLCPKCEAGDWSPEGSSECFECPAGTFASAPRSTACTQCAYGKFSAAGADSCKLCPFGTYNTNVQQDIKGCLPCPAGKVSSKDRGACVAPGSPTAATSFLESESVMEAEASPRAKKLATKQADIAEKKRKRSYPPAKRAPPHPAPIKKHSDKSKNKYEGIVPVTRSGKQSPSTGAKSGKTAGVPSAPTPAIKGGKKVKKVKSRKL